MIYKKRMKCIKKVRQLRKIAVGGPLKWNTIEILTTCYTGYSVLLTFPKNRVRHEIRCVYSD